MNLILFRWKLLQSAKKGNPHSPDIVSTNRVFLHHVTSLFATKHHKFWFVKSHPLIIFSNGGNLKYIMTVNFSISLITKVLHLYQSITSFLRRETGGGLQHPSKVHKVNIVFWICFRIFLLSSDFVGAHQLDMKHSYTVHPVPNATNLSCI